VGEKYFRHSVKSKFIHRSKFSTIEFVDKGKLSERRGRKATGLRDYPMTAGLPKMNCMTTSRYVNVCRYTSGHYPFPECFAVVGTMVCLKQGRLSRVN